MVADPGTQARGAIINPARILIVDDNVDFAFSLGEILKDENYRVESAHTGEDALDVFRRQDFDIVLLDMKLPRISGVEVFLELRDIKPGIQVLMMSGHSVTDLLAQAVDGGFHRIYYRPYQLESLLESARQMTDPGVVLVVDDAPGLARDVEQALAGEGRSVLVAEESHQAFEQLAAKRFDLLLLDLERPVIGGLEVYWELSRRGHAVPTVIRAPAAGQAYVTIEKLNQFPVCGYFIKPFDPLDLLPVLEQMSQRA